MMHRILRQRSALAVTTLGDDQQVATLDHSRHPRDRVALAELDADDALCVPAHGPDFIATADHQLESGRIGIGRFGNGRIPDVAWRVIRCLQVVLERDVPGGAGLQRLREYDGGDPVVDALLEVDAPPSDVISQDDQTAAFITGRDVVCGWHELHPQRGNAIDVRSERLVDDVVAVEIALLGLAGRPGEKTEPGEIGFDIDVSQMSRQQVPRAWTSAAIAILRPIEAEPDLRVASHPACELDLFVAPGVVVVGQPVESGRFHRRADLQGGGIEQRSDDSRIDVRPQVDQPMILPIPGDGVGRVRRRVRVGKETIDRIGRGAKQQLGERLFNRLQFASLGEAPHLGQFHAIGDSHCEAALTLENEASDPAAGDRLGQPDVAGLQRPGGGIAADGDRLADRDGLRPVLPLLHPLIIGFGLFRIGCPCRDGDEGNEHDRDAES